MTRKVSVPDTRCLFMPLSHVPMPWHNRPSLLQYDSSYFFGFWDGAVAGGILVTPLSMRLGTAWIKMLQEWTKGKVGPWENIVGKPGVE